MLSELTELLTIWLTLAIADFKTSDQIKFISFRSWLVAGKALYHSAYHTALSVTSVIITCLEVRSMWKWKPPSYK